MICFAVVFIQYDSAFGLVFLLFLFFLKSVPLPFLSRKKRKQKKVICGTVALRCCCLFREHATQNGRFTYEPSVFSFHAGHAGKRLFSDKSTVPQCLLFLFFKKRNRSLLFFLEEKTVSLRGKRSPSDGRTQAYPALSSVGIPQRVCLPPPPCLCPCPPRLRAGFPVQTDHAKENRLRLSFFSALLPLSPTCSTKRTVQIRTVRFFRSGQDVRESILSQNNILPRSVFCFFSSRKENVPI